LLFEVTVAEKTGHSMGYEKYGYSQKSNGYPEIPEEKRSKDRGEEYTERDSLLGI